MYKCTQQQMQLLCRLDSPARQRFAAQSNRPKVAIVCHLYLAIVTVTLTEVILDQSTRQTSYLCVCIYVDCCDIHAVEAVGIAAAANFTVCNTDLIQQLRIALPAADKLGSGTAGMLHPALMHLLLSAVCL